MLIMLNKIIIIFFMLVVLNVQNFGNFSSYFLLDVQKSINCIRGTVSNYLNIITKAGGYSNALFFKQLKDVCDRLYTFYLKFYAIVDQKTVDAVMYFLSIDLPDDLLLEDLVTYNAEVVVGPDQSQDAEDDDQELLEALVETLYENLPYDLLLNDLVKYVAKRKAAQLLIDNDQVIINAKIDNSENLSDCLTDSMIKYSDVVREKGSSDEFSFKQIDEMRDCFSIYDKGFLLRENQKLQDAITDNLNNLAAEISPLLEDLSAEFSNIVTINTDIYEWVLDIINNEIPALNGYFTYTLNYWGTDTENCVKLYDKQEILTDEKLKLDEFIEQNLNNNIDYSYLDFDFGSSVLIEYLPIVVALILALLLSCFIVIISYLLSIQNPEIEKISTYECGFEPYEDARHKVGIKFYIFAILFIIFDVETMYLIPWCVSLSITNYVGYWIMIDFLFELGVSFLYVWLVGGLDWD